MAAGAAFAAALISLGTAGAAGADPIVVDTYPPPDPYDVLFGAEGAQGAANATLDSELLDQNPGGYDALYTSVAAFEDGNDHALTDTIYALDPSAFYEQVSPGITGTLAGGAYLVPDNVLGYLVTGLDYDVLNPTGLGYLLDPLIELLAGQPPF